MENVIIPQTQHLNRIYARLFAARPQSMAIIGDRQMGKSTLLSQIADSEVFRNYKPENLNPLFFRYNIQATGSDWQKLLHQVCSDLASATGSELMSQDYYHELQELIKQHQDKHNFYLLFDDFELLTQNPQVPLEFYSFLRSLANSYMIAYITSSRASLQTLCVSRDICESPFFNIFTNLELKGFSAAETAELAARMAPQADAEKCQSVCAGLPGLTIKWLSQSAHDLQEFVAAESQYLQDLLEQFDPDTRQVLHSAAQGKAIPQPHRFIEETLRRKGYLTPSGKIASAALELHLQSAEPKETKGLFKRLFKK